MIRKGSKVRWKWGSGFGEGKVNDTYVKEVSVEIEGTNITRKGEKNNKALLIIQKDGSKVLKLEQEVEKL